MTNAKRIILTIAALFTLALLAGCAATPSSTDECPLLGVATGNSNCLVDYYGSGGDQGPAGGEGEGEGEGEGDSE